MKTFGVILFSIFTQLRTSFCLLCFVLFFNQKYLNSILIRRNLNDISVRCGPILLMLVLVVANCYALFLMIKTSKRDPIRCVNYIVLIIIKFLALSCEAGGCRSDLEIKSHLWDYRLQRFCGICIAFVFSHVRKNLNFILLFELD